MTAIDAEPTAAGDGSTDLSPTVTIILTNYNHSRFLNTSLGGIVNQTHNPDEIIVVDDGSTDDSLDVISGYAELNNNIRVLANRENRGVQYSISRALGAATGDWIVWASADDKLLPTFLEEGIEAIRQNPDTGVVFSRLATFLDKTGEERIYSGDGPGEDAFNIGDKVATFTPDVLMERLASGYLWLSGNTAIVRKEFLFDVGAFVPELEWHSDWFAFYAVALRYGAVGIPQTLAMMRVVENTYSATGMNNPRAQAKVMAALLDLLKRPDFADLRVKFRARPCLFSPFAKPMLRALARRPRDWDLLIRLVNWAISHRYTQYHHRSLATRLPHGLKPRILRIVAGIGLRATNLLTPREWLSY